MTTVVNQRPLDFYQCLVAVYAEDKERNYKLVAENLLALLELFNSILPADEDFFFAQ